MIPNPVQRRAAYGPHADLIEPSPDEPEWIEPIEEYSLPGWACVAVIIVTIMFCLWIGS